MNIWLLTANIDHPTRTMRSAVILAETEQGAKSIATRNCWGTNAEQWRVSKVEPIASTAQFFHEYLL